MAYEVSNKRAFNTHIVNLRVFIFTSILNIYILHTCIDIHIHFMYIFVFWDLGINFEILRMLVI